MKILSRPVVRQALLALVAAAVLCAQWIGPRHRIEHADRLGAPAQHTHHAEHALPAVAAGIAGSADETSPWHDCAAFDAAALGDGPPSASAACKPPPASAAPVAARVSGAGASPQALGYLSRAPPRA